MSLPFVEVGSAGIEEHVHLHIIPRWTGDTSFITVLSDVRIIPEHPRATTSSYRILSNFLASVIVSPDLHRDEESHTVKSFVDACDVLLEILS